MFYWGNCATCKGDTSKRFPSDCNSMFLDKNCTKQTHMCYWRGMKVEGLENLEKAFVIHL